LTKIFTQTFGLAWRKALRAARQASESRFLFSFVMQISHLYAPFQRHSEKPFTGQGDFL